MAVRVVPGFSLTNRWLLYTSYFLAPAQFVSGLNSNCPSNVGFLAYNWYTQIQWYKLMSGKDEIHAISLILPHFNLLYAFSYLGGASSGSIFMGVLLGLGTAGVMILNTVSAWKAWAVHQSQGYDVYQFFFFGWRTLTEGWHRGLFLPWQIFDSVAALWCVGMAFYAAVYVPGALEEELEDVKWWHRFPAIPIGAIVMLLMGWPLVMWTELIISRNHLESETDMIAVWLFVAQVATMLMPSCGARLSCCGGALGRRKSSSVV
ncbi:uncharacterized protein P884DRAFT_195882 [Thermothelomyces heterothallicus CBS 202.75]|uniref:uncharacterized protein n=1 Tax=Thermothelomyces heterothallicus CBS 202.75 TaxID=1149848 RepID=UPI0037447E45